jgi:hypothetical protein
MTTRQIQNCIDILKSIDPTDPTGFDTAIAAFEQMGKLPFFILDFPALPINVFHSRTHETNDYFVDFADISIPPAKFVKSFARCNVPHQPVFYCSDFRQTSYMELLEYWVEEKKEEFLYVTIGKWKIRNSLKLLIVTSPFEGDRITSFDKMHGIKLDHFINQQCGEMKSAMIMFYKFLYDKFRKPAKKDPQTYIITSAYCNFAFNLKQDTIDAILYPSVPYDGKGFNLAIKPTYNFEKNMKLVMVARDTFKRIDDDPLPIFQQADFRKAQNIDYDKKKIVW